jgi:hypothetical protein
MRTAGWIRLCLAVTGLQGEPHPETGLEFWAIQAGRVPGERVAYGRISRVTFVAGRENGGRETRVELQLDRVLHGEEIRTALLVEPGRRFNDLVFNRDITGMFIFHLQPSSLTEGFITYWNGFGVREASETEWRHFVKRWREWNGRSIPDDKALQRGQMLEWGFRCAEHAVTRWEGVLAIRDAIHPGPEYRDHDRAMAVLTPERWARFRDAWFRIRNDEKRDHRIGTVMMEAAAWLTPDPLFHHEVRFWSAKLRTDVEHWRDHFDAFWREVERRIEVRPTLP